MNENLAKAFVTLLNKTISGVEEGIS